MTLRIEPVLVTKPSTSPVTLSEVKDQIRVRHSVEDGFLYRLIRAATHSAETFTGLGIMTQTWELRIPALTGVITLPKRPLQSVVSIKYLDSDSVEQTLAPSEYQVTGIGAERTFATVGAGTSLPWPAVGAHQEAVKIRFTVGFGASPTVVPDLIRHAIIVACATWYEFREDVVQGGGSISELPFASQSLLEYWRRPALA